MTERPGARRVGLQPEDLSLVMEQLEVSEEQVRRALRWVATQVLAISRA